MFLCVLIAGCTIGTSTTDRPAFNRPVIGPDGSFWDASNAADRHDNNALRLLVSARFIHEALLPNGERDEPTSTAQFDAERQRLESELKPFEATVARMIESHAEQLRRLTANRFVEVGRPEYDIKYRDGNDRADGPNRATLVVQCWPKGVVPADSKPETIRVQFVQDRQRWLIDGLDPDPLKGAFSR